jgi:hypothetical protein
MANCVWHVDESMLPITSTDYVLPVALLATVLFLFLLQSTVALSEDPIPGDDEEIEIYN